MLIGFLLIFTVPISVNRVPLDLSRGFLFVFVKFS